MREIRPQAGPQTAFLSSPADVAIYGGAAGGGKTWALLLEPLRHVANPRFGSVIFRRTHPQIALEGGMWDESSSFYPLLGARPNKNDLSWNFPSGARVTFAHMQHETTVANYLGAQIALLEFDQLEQFSGRMFWPMFGRNRSVSGVAPYVRASCNPDPDSFLVDLLAWWIDQETGYPIRERSGVVRWFYRAGEEMVWGATRDEIVTRYPDAAPFVQSMTFIAASVYDNQILLKADPGYVAKLMAMDEVDRERYLRGNWKVRLGAGLVFNRGWFEIVPGAPAGGVEMRGFDFAGTEKKLRRDDPDYTASMKVRYVNGVYYVTDVTAVQVGPGEVDDYMIAIVENDWAFAKANNIRYGVRWEEEPGSASKRETVKLVKRLAGINARGIRSQDDKITRAKPLAAQARVGNVKLVKAQWNEPFLVHMHNQPHWPHDDIMDASSTAYNGLVEDAVVTIVRNRR